MERMKEKWGRTEKGKEKKGVRKERGEKVEERKGRRENGKDRRKERLNNNNKNYSSSTFIDKKKGLGRGTGEMIVRQDRSGKVAMCQSLHPKLSVLKMGPPIGYIKKAII
jgi:hypothetical protein